MKVPTIKGKDGLILRPMSVADAKDFRSYFMDSEVTVFLKRHGDAMTLKAEKEWIKKTQRDPNKATFSIEVDGELIGNVSLNKISKEHKHAEYGIAIGNKKFWGQGHGTEAGKLILDFAFRRLKLHRVYLSCWAFNERGYRSYKRIGFKDEGIYREHLYRNGHYHDRFNMGILKNEFLKLYKKPYGKTIRKN